MMETMAFLTLWCLSHPNTRFICVMEPSLSGNPDQYNLRIRIQVRAGSVGERSIVLERAINAREVAFQKSSEMYLKYIWSTMAAEVVFKAEEELAKEPSNG